MGAKDVLGKEGEQVAVGYLEGCGFRILDRNWRCVDGEIDIVAAERRTFVVCEVKTRSGTRYGTPLDAVGQDKRRRLRRLSAQWLSAHGIRFDQIRMDLLGLLRDGADGFTIEHIRGVG
jgi:putative endonuclease